MMHETSNNIDTEYMQMTLESMKHILIKTFLAIHQNMKENAVSDLENDDRDAIISKRIMKWILSHLQNWLFNYMSYPISVTKDYFHLFISGNALINCQSIKQTVHCIEYIMIHATHMKYDAIYDSIIDAR